MNILSLQKNKLLKGFSLVEIIIYLAIFTAVSILVINSLIVSMSSFGATHTNHILMESGLSSMDRMSREIRDSISIDLVSSSLATGTLVLIRPDSSSLKISKNGNALNIYQSSDPLVGLNLLDSNIAVDSLVFRRIDTVAGEAVKIEMIIRDTKSKNNRTEKFYNTIILRGSY